MTAKEYLLQIRKQVDKIKQLERRKARYLELAASPSSASFEPHLDASCPDGARFEHFVEMADEIDSMLSVEKELLKQLIEKVTDEILMLDNINESDLLIYRYVKLISWEEIARLMRFSESWLYKLHRSALISFQKKIVEYT